jgi:ABC-2 type transport system ATP-binding protein
MTDGPVLRAEQLGRRFGRRWVLRECTWEVPAGSVAGLVGPNGAGKTTLLRLATGLLAASEGSLTVLGQRPRIRGAPGGLSFLAQDKPLYRQLRVDEMLRAGAALNRGGRWDAACVRRLVAAAGVSPRARVGALSGGQCPDMETYRGRSALGCPDMSPYRELGALAV